MDDVIGEKFSHFYIIRQLGSGGMGVVFEAQDTRLPRSVAIKFLKSTLWTNDDALRRFKREARLASSLNHPNICTIYDVDEANGHSFIAMELLEGHSLKSRLEAGPLPLHEVLAIGNQIADALTAAHDQGIVHRDISPGNVFITNRGLVKLLDFGLAKHFSTSGGDAETTDDLTATGAVAGTLHYMSPERLGDDVSIDRRSDLYSLGILLYQMAAGQRPFDDVPRSELVAAIQSEPHIPLRQVAPHQPAELERIIDKLLAKRPEDRYQTAGALRGDLNNLTRAAGADIAPSRGNTSVTTAGPSRRTRIRFSLAAAMVVAVAATAWIGARASTSAAEITQISFSNLIDKTQFGGVTITPDGRALLYTGSAEAGRPLMLLRLDQRTAHALPGTEEGREAFVAPSGNRFAFIANDHRVRVVAIDRGPSADTKAASRLARLLDRLPSSPANLFGATRAWRYGNGAWINDTEVVTEARGPGLSMTVPGDSNKFIALTKVDTARGEIRHVGPLVLPEKKAIVFTVMKRVGRGLVTGPLAIASLDSDSLSIRKHVLLDVSARRAIAFVDGWLLFTSENGKAIMAVRLDVEGKRRLGDPISVLEEEAGELETASLADNGTLLFVRRPTMGAVRFVTSTGAPRPKIVFPEGAFMNPRLSPDGRRFAVQVSSARGEDVWIYDIASGSRTALTTSGQALLPTWTPDGRHIVFIVSRVAGLAWQPVDGSAAAKKIPGTENALSFTVAPDGKTVVFHRSIPTDVTLWSVPLDGGDAPRKLIDDPFINDQPAISPDGRWLAYTSRTTGVRKIWVRPFRGPGLAVQVSEREGTEPAWSAKGDFIYYRELGQFMAAAVSPSPVAPNTTLVIGARTPQFKDISDNTMPHRDYDVEPNGSGFLTIAPRTPEPIVVLHWVDKLRERLAREP
jgi:serine/threonine-protein kinase